MLVVVYYSDFKKDDFDIEHKSFCLIKYTNVSFHLKFCDFNTILLRVLQLFRNKITALRLVLDV